MYDVYVMSKRTRHLSIFILHFYAVGSDISILKVPMAAAITLTLSHLLQERNKIPLLTN